MAEREWKPGDVGINLGNRVFRTNSGWQFTDGSGIEGYPYTVRPLVVIDPEDREQVERLVRAYKPGVVGVVNMQTALRSLLAPPKPEEPTGHFAVVEDANGHRWVNYRDPRSSRAHERPWVSSSDSEDFREWSDVPAVRVLSEGVQP